MARQEIEALPGWGRGGQLANDRRAEWSQVQTLDSVSTASITITSREGQGVWEPARNDPNYEENGHYGARAGVMV